MSEPTPDQQDLAAIFRRHESRIYAYARRHVGVDLCDDVVSETFLVAWRRLDRIPADPLPWLLVVARNVMANHRRTSARADQVWWAAVNELWSQPTQQSDQDGLADRSALLAALGTCTRLEREALLLVAWDGLSAAGAARVAGCSVRAFTVRLHRARRRLERASQTGDEPARAVNRPLVLKETP